MTSPLPRTVILGLLCVSGALIVLERWHTRNEPLERDLMTYAVVGHELLAGRSLYADVWDHKPPGIHVAFAAAELAFGYGRTAILALNIACALLSLGGVYMAASAPPRGAATGLWAAGFWAVVCADLATQANQPNTEAFLNVCLVWALALLLRLDAGARLARLAGVGLLLGTACLFKPVVVFSAAGLLGVHALFPAPGARPRTRSLLESAAAGMVVAGVGLATLTWFAWQGTLASFGDAVITYNSAYAGSVSWNVVRGLAPWHLLPRFLRAVLPLIAVAWIGLAYALGSRRLTRPWSLALAYAVTTLLSIASPGHFWPHYYQLWLPLAAVTAAWLLDDLGRARPRLEHAAPAALLLLLLALQAPSFALPADEWSRRKYGEIFITSERVAARVDLLLEPGEKFYHWGSETGLFFASGRSPSSGVFYALPLVDGPLAARLSERVLRDLARSPPALVVFNADTPGLIDHPVVEWLRARYHPLPENSTHKPFRLLVKGEAAALEEPDR